MSESERSEASDVFGTTPENDLSEDLSAGFSSDDAAELEQLRREAAVLREQLENTVGGLGAGRSARLRGGSQAGQIRGSGGGEKLGSAEVAPDDQPAEQPDG